MTDTKMIVDLAEQDAGIGFCADYDEDCCGVRCKLACWLYAPEEGICPFLLGSVKP